MISEQRVFFTCISKNSFVSYFRYTDTPQQVDFRIEKFGIQFIKDIR